MFDLSIKLEGTGAVIKSFRLLPDAVHRANKRAMRMSIRAIARHIAKSKFARPGGEGSPLHARTGQLARDIILSTEEANAVQEVGDTIIGIIGSNLPYARIHEFGGTIQPKKAKWLTIPTQFNLTERGIMRIPPRQVKGAFFVKVENNLIMFGESPVESGIVPMFVLKKRVDIPKRPYLTPGAEEKVDDVVDIFEDELYKEIIRVWE